MDGRSEKYHQKPLHGYKSLIQGQVRRLRRQALVKGGQSTALPSGRRLRDLFGKEPRDVLVVAGRQSFQDQSGLYGVLAPTLTEATTQGAKRRLLSTFNASHETHTNREKMPPSESEQKPETRHGFSADGYEFQSMHSISKTETKSCDAPLSKMDTNRPLSSHMERFGKSTTLVESGGSNDANNISVEVEDPLTVDLLLAEEGQFFHDNKTGMSHELANRQQSIGANSYSGFTSMQVATYRRIVTEVSSNSVISVKGNLLPLGIDMQSVAGDLRDLPLPDVFPGIFLKGGAQMRQTYEEERPIKQVRFADELERRPSTRAGARHKDIDAVKTPLVVDHAFERDEMASKITWTNFGRGKAEGLDQEVGEPNSTEARLRASPPTQAVESYDNERIQKVWNKHETTLTLPQSEEKLIPTQTLTPHQTELLYLPTSCSKEIDNTGGNVTTMVSHNVSTETDNSQSVSFSDRTKASPRGQRSWNFICEALRVCVMITVMVLSMQVLALCLALGFVTECQRNDIILSPVWGFPWIQTDVSPLAVVIRENLRLVNFERPPT